MRQEEPKKLMMNLAEAAAWRGSRRLTGRNSAPGSMIERLPEHKRKLLRELRSDDIATVYPVCGYEAY